LPPTIPHPVVAAAMQGASARGLLRGEKDHPEEVICSGIARTPNLCWPPTGPSEEENYSSISFVPRVSFFRDRLRYEGVLKTYMLILRTCTKCI